MIVIFAKEDRGAEVEKARALVGRTRRRRKDDMAGDRYWNLRCSYC